MYDHRCQERRDEREDPRVEQDCDGEQTYIMVNATAPRKIHGRWRLVSSL